MKADRAIWRPRPYRPADIEIAGRLKASDLAEIEAMGETPHDGIARSVAGSDVCEIIEIDGVSEVIWGASFEGDGLACFWMLTTPRAPQSRGRFVRETDQLCRRTFDLGAQRLYNFVYLENAQSRRLANLCRFVERDAIEIGPRRAPFVPIARDRVCVKV